MKFPAPYILILGGGCVKEKRKLKLGTVLFTFPRKRESRLSTSSSLRNLCLRKQVAGIQCPSFVIPAKAGIQCSTFVIPAKAGIQRYLNKNLFCSSFPPTREQAWIPAFAGMTGRKNRTVPFLFSAGMTEGVWSLLKFVSAQAGAGMTRKKGMLIKIKPSPYYLA